MKNLASIHFKSRNDFRKWLVKNHNNSPGIWMINYKKYTKKENIVYDDAVEEAICFGWIDSLVKKIDEETYVRKFTPRINTKNWSEINKMRALKMIRLNKMAEAGLTKFNRYLQTEETIPVKNENSRENPRAEDFPAFFIDALSENEPALMNFKNLSPSQQRNYLMWVTHAKKEETIHKRLTESIHLLKENKKLGMK